MPSYSQIAVTAAALLAVGMVTLRMGRVQESPGRLRDTGALNQVGINKKASIAGGGGGFENLQQMMAPRATAAASSKLHATSSSEDDGGTANSIADLDRLLDAGVLTKEAHLEALDRMEVLEGAKGVNGNKGLLPPPPPPSHQSIGLKDALKQMKAFEAHEEKEQEQAAQPGAPVISDPNDPCTTEAVSRVCCGPFAKKEGNWCFCNEGRGCQPVPPHDTAAFHINVPKKCIPFNQIAAAVAADNEAKAAAGTAMECYGVPDDSFQGPAPPPPVVDGSKTYTHKYGFYLHVFHDPAAV
eukprot:gene15323-18047_t